MLQNADKLRLDALQKAALESSLQGVDGEVYLFGSRLKPNARGGDVDILVLTKDNSDAGLGLTLDITRKFQQLCDERIDVTVFPYPQMQSKEQMDFFGHIQKLRIK